MNITRDEIRSLKETALKVREHIIRMSSGGGCFAGASLSCADIIVYLYGKYLNIKPENLNDPSRDYLFLSKGHDVPALYATLAEFGFIKKERLNNHLKASDNIYWHPNISVAGVEFHSGSLGHLLSVASGVAMDCKLKKAHNKVVVILGDGELNEGSIWEAMLVASAYKLDNLVAVVDRNHFQANMETEKLIPLEPLEDKFESFGFAVATINGHSFTELHHIFSQIPFEKDKPSVIIADTVRGKGLPSIEARADRWFCNFSSYEVQMLLEELRGNQKADIKSETLIVR
ncbi:MAG: thiamine pyrophosphate-dependent enzyme [Ignavibacteria bacterium]|nr:thiamine pyrophosphate-dependent enzyme [Ignavibacteria bacterium]